jgi:transposase
MARLQAVIPKQKAGPEATRGDRLFIEAVLFRAKTGMPWRDLPERFGPWKSVYNRFNNWAKKGHREVIFKELQLEVDEVGSIGDGSVVRVHQDASGGKGGPKAMPSAVLAEVILGEEHLRRLVILSQARRRVQIHAFSGDR